MSGLLLVLGNFLRLVLRLKCEIQLKFQATSFERNFASIWSWASEWASKKGLSKKFCFFSLVFQYYRCRESSCVLTKHRAGRTEQNCSWELENCWWKLCEKACERFACSSNSLQTSLNKRNTLWRPVFDFCIFEIPTFCSTVFVFPL